MKGPPLEAALQSGFSTSGLQASPACLGARVVQRISLPCEWESVLPPALRYPAFLRPDREDCAAAGTLKTATDLFVRTLLGADCFGACQHRDTTIVAHGGRIFLGEDFKERFHATHTKNYAHSSISNRLADPISNDGRNEGRRSRLPSSQHGDRAQASLLGDRLPREHHPSYASVVALQVLMFRACEPMRKCICLFVVMCIPNTT